MMKLSNTLILLSLLLGSLEVGATDKEPGTVSMPAYDLPPSSLLSAESKRINNAFAERYKKANCSRARYTGDDPEGVLIYRKCIDPVMAGVAADFEAKYAVDIKPQTIGGVYTEVFTPKAGIAKQNKDRVLINLHGGGFVVMARVGGRMESIPVADIGKIKVVSVDYRQGPEYKFPAASEDVEAVYRELLKSYKPENIGVYGCSAGGMLTAQSVAWFQHKDLPRPGAVSIMCSGAILWYEGDTGARQNAMMYPKKFDLPSMAHSLYLSVEEQNNPLMQPALSEEIMARFPPTLLITATRDGALSAAAYTQSMLTRLGVPAYLHVWEGFGHGFQGNPDLPESREVYDVVARFFEANLGSK